MGGEEMSDERVNAHVTDVLAQKAAANETLMRAIGAIPPEVHKGFDGGAREIAPPIPTTEAEAEAQHNETAVELAQRMRQEERGVGPHPFAGLGFEVTSGED